MAENVHFKIKNEKNLPIEWLGSCGEDDVGKTLTFFAECNDVDDCDIGNDNNGFLLSSRSSSSSNPRPPELLNIALVFNEFLFSALNFKSKFDFIVFVAVELGASVVVGVDCIESGFVTIISIESILLPYFLFLFKQQIF